MKIKWLFLLSSVLGFFGFANAQNNALDFDGSNDWVNCGTDTSLASLRLYDAQGRLVQELSQGNFKQCAWNLGLAPGLYALEIEATEGRFRQFVWAK